LSHFNSHIIATVERYLAFSEKRETINYFLVLQDTGEEPRNTTQLVKECLVSGQPAKSESHHPCSSNLLLDQYLVLDVSSNM